MRASILLLALLLLPSAEAARFRSLGTKIFRDEANQDLKLAPGAEVEISDLKSDPLTAQLDNGKTITFTREELKTYFEFASTNFRNYFRPTLDALGKINNSALAARCAEELQSTCQIDNEDFRRSSLAALLLSCAPSPKPAVIRRTASLPLEDFRKSCSDPTIQVPPPDSPQTWSAPIPLPDCTSDQALVLRANEQKKHAAFIAACPDREASLKNIGLISPEPECMLPAEKAKIKKIVLHATEGSPTSSPKGLFCDYAKGGFNDIPYHFYIARNPQTQRWQIFEGRSLSYQGAHVRANLNADSIGIAIAGDYHPGGPTPAHPFAKTETPPAEAVQLAQSLIAQLKQQYPGIRNIQGHGEALHEGNHCHKNCPGPGCQYLVNRLRDKFFANQEKKP